MLTTESVQEREDLRRAFYLEHEEAICGLVRRLRILGSAMAGLVASRDPDEMRATAAAAREMTAEITDELRAITGCEQ